MNFIPKIFIIEFLLSLFLGFLRLFTGELFSILFRAGLSVELIDLYSSVLSIAQVVINPALVFIIFFVLGRNFRLQSNYLSAFLSLLLGGIAGGYSGYLLDISLAVIWGGSLVSFGPGWAFFIIYGSFDAVVITLVGFGGMSLGYFSKLSSAPSEGQSL
jgi:hypothetical protein